jgi:hypothetical protein
MDCWYPDDQEKDRNTPRRRWMSFQGYTASRDRIIPEYSDTGKEEK